MRIKKLIIGLIIVGVLAIGTYHFVLPLLKNSSSTEPSTAGTTSDKIEKKVSLDSIRELAKTSSLKINTTTENRINIDNEPSTGTRIDLILESGKLYIVNGSNKSLVKDMEEEVVMMKNANNDCSTSKQHILILTSKGNLYILDQLYKDNQRFDTNILSLLKKNESIELNLRKTNANNKVLAITEYYHNKACRSCGRGDVVVYTEDGKFRTYKTMKEIESLEKDEICGGPFNIYLTIYENGKAADNSGRLLKNRYSGDLVIKEIFRNDKNAYLIDHLNYLYILKNENNSLKLELYRDTRVLKYTKNGNNLRVEFESGHTIDFINWKEVDEN